MLWSKTKCGKVIQQYTYIRHYDHSQVPWIVKTDDDMINNIWKLGALVEALKFQRWSKTNDLVAFCVQALKRALVRNTITCSTKTERVIRTKSGGRIDKWVNIFPSERGACQSHKSQVIPFDEWPDEFFPTNCWGVVYIMSQYVRNKLIQVGNHWFDNSQNPDTYNQD